MIKVQAFKQSDQEPEQALDVYANEKKEAEREKKTRFVPYALFLVFAGFILYLKSFLPTSVTAATGSEEKPTEDGTEASDPVRAASPDEIAATEQSASPEEKSEEEESEDEELPDNVVRFSSSGVYTPAIDEFMASDSPAIEFSSVRRNNLPAIGSSTSPMITAPINDNAPPRSSGSNSGGGGGGIGPGGPDPHGPNGPGDDGEEPGNRAPRTSGIVRLQDMVGFHAYFISASALLSGASDPDGDPLTALHLSSSSGTLTATQGGWLFDAVPGILGDVTFSYWISDSTAAVRQTAYLRVVADPPIVGTDGDDNIVGTPYEDDIDGGAGDDNIDARGGNDIVRGGSGNDHIIGGAGNDVIYAGCGDDIVFAGTGNDIVFAGCGNDRVFGEDGNDILFGEDGDDLLVGGKGADELLGGEGKDELRGEEGNDTLDGGAGDDVLDGGAGNDVILAGAGDDIAKGGAGDDFISDGMGQDIVEGGSGNDHTLAALDQADDHYSGGDGSDTLDYSLATTQVVVDLEAGVAQGQEIGTDTVSGYENVVTGEGNDHIIAGEAAVEMTGGEGEDTFEFNRSHRRYDEDRDEDHDENLVVGKITDFTVGDRLIVADYEIRYRDDRDLLEEVEDAFENAYFADGNDHRPIRFRFEKIDDEDMTIVEVRDANGDGVIDTYSIEVELPGRHNLELTVTTVS